MKTSSAGDAHRAVLAAFTLPSQPHQRTRNVTMVSASGARTAGVDGLVRGHRIEAIGPNLTILAAAQMLAGDSLLVYPGIVDGWGAVKFEFPRGDAADQRAVTC